MNKQQRKELAEIIADLQELKNRLNNIATEEHEKFDNLSEGLQSTEKGQALIEGAETVEEQAGILEDLISELENLSEQ